MNTNIKKWDNHHSQERFRTQYPNGSVVRFMVKTFTHQPREGIKILDIGCGCGRHIKLFAENGFTAYGIDFSDEGIKQAKNYLARHNLHAELKVGDIGKLPYANSFFDGAVVFGVYYYTDKKGMINNINELHRILKPGATAFLALRTADDYRYGKGLEIESNTFILNTNETNEGNLIMRFLSLSDVGELFNNFSHINIEKNELTSNGLRILNSDWFVTVVK